MRVIFAIPTHSGLLNAECVLSLFTAQGLLNKKGIEYDVIFLSNCAYLPIARNTLVGMFMKDKEATDLFFVDADVGFDATAVIKILERPEKIVAGIYPLKREMLSFPVKIKTVDGVPIGRDGLIEAELLPTGFMRIKREVFESMEKAYPELKYTNSVVDVGNSDLTEAYDYFNMGVGGGYKWTSEDYAFCERWTAIGGQLWVCPDIEFTHVGNKGFKGNYHEYLLRLKGGEKEGL